MSAYAAERIERPGLANVYWGMVFFLISEIFLFGNLFWVYFYLRAKTPIWPPEGAHLAVALMSVNTILLLASSVAMQWAIYAGRRGRRGELVGALWATILLGGAFLVIKGWEWTHSTFGPWDHAYGSIYFTLTGFHALHVLVGLLILAALLIRALNHRFSSERHLAVEVGGLYWHFVDIIWIFVFSSIFLVR